MHRAHAPPAAKDGCERRVAAGTALEVGQVEPEVRSPRQFLRHRAQQLARHPTAGPDTNTDVGRGVLDPQPERLVAEAEGLPADSGLPRGVL